MSNNLKYINKYHLNRKNSFETLIILLKNMPNNMLNYEESIKDAELGLKDENDYYNRIMTSNITFLTISTIIFISSAISIIINLRSLSKNELRINYIKYKEHKKEAKKIKLQKELDKLSK
jgi:hypothetical protein